MGKVFIHHPLKRAEFKRLLEPPPPRAPVSLPIFQAPDFEEKRRRAEARISSRLEEQKTKEERRVHMEVLGSQFTVVLVNNDDFNRWMTKIYSEEELIEEFEGKFCSLLMSMSLPDRDRVCLRCMSGIAHPTCSGVMHANSKLNSKEVMTFFLCKKCSTLSDKALSLLIGRVVLEEIEAGGPVFHIGRSFLHPVDADYISLVIVPKMKISEDMKEQFIEYLYEATEGWDPRIDR